MGIFDFLKKNRNDEAIADLVQQSEKLAVGWYQAVDRAGVFIGFKCICDVCHAEHLIQGLAFFKNPVFKCTCGKVHDLEQFFKANAESNKKDIREGIKRARLPEREEDLPKRSLAARGTRRVVEVGGWNAASDASDYEQAGIATVGWIK